MGPVGKKKIPAPASLASSSTGLGGYDVWAEPWAVSAKTVAESVVVVGTTRPLGLLACLLMCLLWLCREAIHQHQRALFWISWPHPGEGFGITPLEHLIQ